MIVFNFSISSSIAEHGNSGTSSVMPGKGGKVTVQKQKLQDVVHNDTYCINNHLDDLYEPRPIEDIIQDAKTFVEREFSYDLLSSNCEHFATLLRYGKPQCKQVRFGKTSHTELYCTHKCLKITGLQTILCQNVLN